MRHSLKASGDLRGTLTGDLLEMEAIHTGAMNDLVADTLDELRDQVRQAGLGGRLANTWRARAYPVGGKSLNPAGYIWSNAPKLIAVYAEGAVILPTDGRRYLAIPTRNVPMKGRGKLMTPLDVEVAFNQDLIVRPGKGGRQLAFVNVIAAKNKRGFRKATKGRLAQGRNAKLVLMFTLVPSVRVPKRVDPDAVFARQAATFAARVQARWDAAALGRSR